MKTTRFNINDISTSASLRFLFLLLIVSVVSSPAFAVLPTPVSPSDGTASGDYIALIQQYWKAGVAVIVLIFGAAGFFTVGGGAVAKFNEYRMGRADLGDLTLFAVLGVVMLVTVVYLLTTADGII